MAIGYPLALAFWRRQETRKFASDANSSTGFALQDAELMASNDKPELVVTDWFEGEPIAYRCSQCEQVLFPPEDRSPEDAVAEVQAAFQEHIGEVHADQEKD